LNLTLSHTFTLVLSVEKLLINFPGVFESDHPPQTSALVDFHEIDLNITFFLSHNICQELS
jgi:hypothetical protein